MVNLAVYAEGPTEWYAIYRLYSRDILSKAELVGRTKRNDIGTWLKSREQIRDILTNKIPAFDGILLAFDQEDDNTAKDTADAIAGGSLSWSTVAGFDNVFKGQLSNEIPVVLHVATAMSPDGNRDFDGYLLKMLDYLGGDAVDMWFKECKVPKYLKNHFDGKTINQMELHNLGLKGIPELMNSSHWDILRSKTMLYAYITALQADKSHVWFSEKMIEYAREDALRHIFASLITAWDSLTVGE